MRNKSPAFQWYPDKALTDTRRLSWTAKGIYRELLDVIWMQFQKNCTIPDDDTFIASELGCDMDLWLSAKKEIMNEYRPLFKKTPQGLLSKGLKKESEKQKEWREKSRAGGVKSANARKQRAKDTKGGGKGGSSVVDDCLQPNGNSLSLSPSPSSTPKDNKDNIRECDFKTALPHWNMLAEKNGLAKIEKLTEKRKKKYRSRCREVGESSFWRTVETELPKLGDFARGGGNTSWKLDFDFLVNSDNNFTKFAEGKYRKETRRRVESNI